MIMHEHMGYFYSELSFCLCFFLKKTCLYLGSEPRFKVNEEHPSFRSILHPSCFTSLGSETCVPFSTSEEHRGSLSTHLCHICTKCLKLSHNMAEKNGL